ncbi:MAG: hypothetical protein QM783_20975 [Phycisphaerales bacterium]
MKRIILLFVLITTIGASSQQNVNDYQYVVVPAKFSIFKENNRFNLNTTTKLLLEKYGFKTYMSTDLIPSEIGDNCQRLYADLVEDKGFMVTKIKIILKDCRENIVYESEFGKSREKDFSIAYNQAFREAAKSFDGLNYKYSGKSVAAASTTQPVNAVHALEDKPGEALVVVPASSEEFYFAQPTSTGYQIVDTTPKVIMRLFKTSQKDVFIAEKGNSKGVVILKNGQWFFESYENSKLISEALKLKF